jgi:hypothetical protein
MAITSFKPNAELMNDREHNPFWISSPTLAHIKHLLFDTAYPRWLWTTMTVAIGSTTLSPDRLDARRLCDRTPAFPRQLLCRPRHLSRLSGAAVDPVHPARHRRGAVRSGAR